MSELTNEVITTELMIKLGFDHTKTFFKLNGFNLRKHPTMNWLIYRKGKEHLYLQGLFDLRDFILQKEIMTLEDIIKRIKP